MNSLFTISFAFSLFPMANSIFAGDTPAIDIGKDDFIFFTSLVIPHNLKNRIICNTPDTMITIDTNSAIPSITLCVLVIQCNKITYKHTKKQILLD